MRIQNQHLRRHVSSEDKISSLTDDLLQHIISFLKMSDAIKTSLISSRWRCLWTSILSLDFIIDFREPKTYPVAFIDRSLFAYQGPKIKNLFIHISYEDCNSVQVDAWIRYAIKCNVEVLVLIFCANHSNSTSIDWEGVLYKLPYSLFKCRSITNLTLSYCDFKLPSLVQLSSLKTLNISYMNLSTDTIKRLTSECPALEELTLAGCNKLTHMNIIIESPNLKILEIYEYYGTNNSTQVTICAPNLEELHFYYFLDREKYCMKDMSSLRILAVQAFPDIRDHDKFYNKCDGYDHFATLVGDLNHVEDLQLCHFFVQIFSVREVRNLDPLVLRATNLYMETEFSRWELPGISYLLKSSPHVNSLMINDLQDGAKIVEIEREFKAKFSFEEKYFWESKVFDFSSSLQNLEFVDISFLRCAQENDNVEEVLEKIANKIEFARFLLKNSKALKSMRIRCGKNHKPNSELIFKLTETLTGFPRASPCATIDISLSSGSLCRR